jgi:hypothetical protein
MTTTAPPIGTTRSGGPARPRPYLVAPILAVVLVGLGLLLGWHGVDDAASVHRIDEYRRYGYALWDASWYGGQWTLDYSIAFAPVAAGLGLGLLAVVASLVATVSFQDLIGPRGLLSPAPVEAGLSGRARRLQARWRAVTRDVGTRPWAGAALAAAVVFAAGNLEATSIGQVPFLAGEALGLAGLALAARRRWAPAWILALASALLSPLSGLFVALAAGAWFIHTVPAPAPLVARWPGAFLTPPDRPPQTRPPAVERSWRLTAGVVALAAVALIPTLATTILFPDEGQMPFPFSNMLWDLAIAAAIFVVTTREHRVLRAGVVLYAIGLVAAWAVPSPIGVNMGRLGDLMALPIAVLALWSRRRLLLAIVAIPLFLSQWGPTWDAISSAHTTPSTTAAFYRPLDRFLAQVDRAGLDGRVEVVPTEYHWESVYVANVVPLARGWERQSDVTLNPMFYRSGAISPAAYHRWLVGNGVRWVALPAAPLDYAGTAEAKVVQGGRAGLTSVWHDATWRVYEVKGATGLVTGDGTLKGLGNSSMTVATAGEGLVTIREKSNSDWRVTGGAGCLTTEPGDWIGLRTPRAETVTIRLALTGRSDRCAS